MSLINTVKEKLSDVIVYWNKPIKGRYMPFKEIGAYSFGGIGAYCIITLGTACLLATSNTLLTSTIGIDPTDMYIMYVIAVIANIPLTGIRANIVDNTRNKAGKYRPYIVTMAIPTAIICNLMVWFPYSSLEKIFGDGEIFGETKAYVAKCAIVLVLNLLLHFFYYFFYDAYENLIHVLSPDSQERADVSSIKSIVYSLAPTLVNLFTPLIAQNIFHTNSTDIRVYRLLYPFLCVLGILLCIVVYKNTEEKIVQAKAHVVQVKFTDALRAVAKNKYFWIISLAGWIGFLESAYSNIMYWLYNYGGACNGNVYGIIVTIYGNASLWGMLLAPFLIRKWGKKRVLVVTNMFNILFILMMLPVVREITNLTIWLILGCLYMNAFMGSFALILNPSIQADIRDYQQYVTGERIDGMFSAVGTIGTVITLATSSVLPMIYERGGLTKENAAKVTSNPEILNRVISDGKTVGEILKEQLANGQNNYANANSALYDPDILLSLLRVLIIFSAVGALFNVIPYFWYDFNETKQKSVVRVLKIRAMFEDYGKGILREKDLVETCDIITESKELADKELGVITKNYRSVKDKAERKVLKKEYKAKLKENEEIEIAKFVVDEVNKFSTDLYISKIAQAEKTVSEGHESVASYNLAELKSELQSAKKMSRNSKLEKEIRSSAIDTVRSKINALKAYNRYFNGKAEFVEPEYIVLDNCFSEEEKIEEQIKELNRSLVSAKKSGDKAEVKKLKAEIKSAAKKRKAASKHTEEEMNRHVYYNRAAKPFIDAEKLIAEKNNYGNFEEIFAKYDAAVEKIAEDEAREEVAAKAEAEQKKADREARKKSKK